MSDLKAENSKKLEAEELVEVIVNKVVEFKIKFKKKFDIFFLFGNI